MHVTVERDGSVTVTEDLTYAFDGPFTGGYRDVPVRPGESITNISVSENGRAYSPGASAELGSSGAPDTFGTADIDNAMRIVWHYQAFNETRTFTVSYTFTGLTQIYDDVGDVTLQVWGDEWDSSLERLTASISVPKAPATPSIVDPPVRVWGHSTVAGYTKLRKDGRGANLVATGIPPNTFVEMRVTFPREALRSTGGGVVHDGEGLPKIVAQERVIAAEQDRNLRRDDFVRNHALVLMLLGLLFSFLPAVGIGIVIWARYGREPKVASPVQGFVMEPPTNDPPAMITALLAPGYQRATGDTFTATLFDLIRRRYLDAVPYQTVKKTWGGLKEQDVTDLAMHVRDKDPSDLLEFEKEVHTTIVHATQGKEHILLSELKDEFKGDPAYYSKRFSGFTSDVKAQLQQKGWWVASGRKVAGLTTMALWIAAIVFLLFGGRLLGWDPNQSYLWQGVLQIGVALMLFANAIVLTGFLIARRGWERRSREGAELADKWSAFKKFLGDFAGMKEAPPASIAIWEQVLCYGIAFGIADRVLAAAQL
ncbi:MAG TPA: DUF2207 domain-containing protein, partial [Actinomycetota bacterium]|nr:DUF2207 domain-containing protein [Actinomycetota bacterium]